jgi:hypothetical protein
MMNKFYIASLDLRYHSHNQYFGKNVT